MLHIASKFPRIKFHLEHIYKTFIRSRLEYVSTLWHSSLTVANRNDIEKIQKSAMKIIFNKAAIKTVKSFALSVLRSPSLGSRSSGASPPAWSGSSGSASESGAGERICETSKLYIRIFKVQPLKACCGRYRRSWERWWEAGWGWA